MPSEGSFCYLVMSMVQRKSSRGEQELGATGEKVDCHVFRMKTFERTSGVVKVNAVGDGGFKLVFH